jgi:ABC-type branched-subunit amino acid transport system ATPase component
MNPAGLTVDELSVRFGGLTAVDRVSFTIAPGSISAVIGPNGAGKTTLFNAISGVHPPSSGRVLLDGAPLAAEANWSDRGTWAAVGAGTAAATSAAAGLLPAWLGLMTGDGALARCAAAVSAWSATPAVPWAAVGGAALGATGAWLSWRRSRQSPERAAAAGIARTFQNLRLFRDLSALDNVRLGAHRHLRASAIAAALRLPAHHRDEQAATAAAHEALALVGLTASANRAAGHLPYGHQRRLEIARALALRPRLLLLDEPAAGMNGAEADALEDLVRRIRDRGITVVLIEHHMRLVMRVAEHIVVLHHGALLAKGTPAAIRADTQVIEAYLGRDDYHEQIPATAASGDHHAAPTPSLPATPKTAPADDAVGRSTTARPLLELQGLSARYGQVHALRSIDLQVHTGELVCLLGGNGAGKSTTLLCCSGIHRASGGSIRFGDDDLTHLSAHAIVAKGLVQVPEGRRVFPRLTVAENLRMGAWLRRDRAAIARDSERVYTLFPILAERRQQEAGTLSGGEQQMLAIGRALMAAPRLLLLDEPSMGVAPLIAARIADAIRQLNRDGLSILLVEQNARLALQLASRAYVLETGRLAAHGPATHIANDPRVIEAYLGA